MERSAIITDTLALILQPAFCVCDGMITETNQAAQQLQIAAGTAVAELLSTGKEEYAAYSGGTLCLTLCIGGTLYNASVVQLEGKDIFRLSPQTEQAELSAMALAAQALREPLSGILTVTDRILESGAATQQLGQINRELYRIQRLLGNMAQAGLYSSGALMPRLEIRNLRAVFDEIFEKATALVEQANRKLEYTGLQQDLFCLADAPLLEQAIYNLLSNAIKFSPEGSTIAAKLIRNGNKLYFSVQDSGAGVAPALRSSVFTRYQRQAGLEDGRYGIGLGMTIVRSAASAHNGTVLMEQPADTGARFTMTLDIRQNADSAVRSPVIPIDISGGYSRELIELSDVLPAALYEN